MHEVSSGGCNARGHGLVPGKASCVVCAPLLVAAALDVAFGLHIGLAQAVEEFNRYRQRPIVIGDQRVAALRVGGRFQTDESAQFIEGIEQSMPVRAVKDADGGILLLYADEVSQS